ncbi:MAG TPA: hypothetical protein PK431_09525 [Chitinophagales bacterium]|nr:hypothetical protein [Chitinophagales bacterium]
MAKLLTLRNIITFFTCLFLVACNKVNEDDVIHKISSEDKDYGNIVDVVSDPESGKQVFIVVRK